MARSEGEWQELRAQFAVLGRQTYLDTATHGPVSLRAAAAASRYYRQWSNEKGIAAFPEWDQGLQDCRSRVAKLVRASAKEIGFVPNTSTAISWAALLFEKVGGSVLTACGEHPSVVTPWLSRGYRVHCADPDPDGLYSWRAYERALQPDTRVIAVSHVRYDTGQVNDLEALGRLARERHLHLVVDAIQSAGILPIDVGLGVDVLGFAGFKWLNAGHGSGAVYIRDGLLEEYGLPLAGNRSRATFDLVQVDELEPLLEARAFELGTACVPNLMALGASLRLLEEVGGDHILARVRYLVDELRTGLKQMGFATRTDGAEHVPTPIVSVIVQNAQGVEHDLRAKGVYVAARGGNVRVAVSWYNDMADIRRCLSAFASAC